MPDRVFEMDVGAVKLPVVIIDSREQMRLDFSNLHIRGVKSLDVIRHKLDEGDYSFSGFEDKVFIERKSVGDLYGSIFQGRERFEREFDRVVEKNYEYRYLIIESTPFAFAQYMEFHKNLIQFNSAFATLMSYAQKYNLKIRWCKTREGSADYIARLGIKILGEQT